jgi:hypothetical protein
MLSARPDPLQITKKNNRMAKKIGTKHHVVIKLEDLNKMFKSSDVIPIPKAFVRSIEFLLCAHNVSLADVQKDTSEIPTIEDQVEEIATTPAIQLTETNFED